MALPSNTERVYGSSFKKRGRVRIEHRPRAEGEPDVGIASSGLRGWIGGAVILIPALQHLLGPILVWYSQKAPERYRLQEVDDAEVFGESSGSMALRHAQLLALDFDYAGAFRLQQRQTATVFAMYRHRPTKMTAAAVIVASRTAEIAYLEFTQTYRDGSVLNVNNSPIAPVYPPSENKLQYRYPNVAQAAALFEMAKKLAAGSAKAHPATALAAGRELETVERFLNNELRELIAGGWYSERVVDGERRLTLKGALVFTWKCAWPGKPILDYLDRRRSMRAYRGC